MRGCSMPVLVVHGREDRMFPVRMAEELHAVCGESAELVVVPDVGHNEPFNRPRLAYWGLILDWLADRRPAGIRSEGDEGLNRAPRYT
jgi:pimeloyl-ACP methyl ester carboxylesterase